MLENEYSVRVEELLTRLPCGVQIPDDWAESLSREGVLQSIEDDRRQFQRRRLPGLAILEITQTLPTVERQKSVFSVYTCDVSRRGVAFLHVSQLYPGEEGRLWLANQRVSIEVSRCNRINERCYAVGAAMAEDYTPNRCSQLGG